MINKLKKPLGICLLLLGVNYAQAQKNFIDQPYVETIGKADTSVTPDKIFISITLSETDNKNKVSVEELEQKMADVFKGLNIDVSNKLSLSDMNSVFKGYFLKGTSVEKSKTYELEVDNAILAGKVMAGLEQKGIANVRIERTEYSKAEELYNHLKAKAILKSKQVAESMATPLQQKIGKALHIVEETSYSNQFQGRIAGVMSENYKSKSVSEESINSEYKKIKFEVRVNVKYLLD